MGFKLLYYSIWIRHCSGAGRKIHLELRCCAILIYNVWFDWWTGLAWGVHGLVPSNASTHQHTIQHTPAHNPAHASTQSSTRQHTIQHTPAHNPAHTSTQSSTRPHTPAQVHTPAHAHTRQQKPAEAAEASTSQHNQIGPLAGTVWGFPYWFIHDVNIEESTVLSHTFGQH